MRYCAGVQKDLSAAGETNEDSSIVVTGRRCVSCMCLLLQLLSC